MRVMSAVFGIDPGTTHSGFALLSEKGRVARSGVLENAALLHYLRKCAGCDPHLVLAIEWVSSYGMAVGHEVFETCRWVGRFQQAWPLPDAAVLIPRVKVKLALCHSARAKDPNVRQALIDLFQPDGRGACPQIGTRAYPGPLYGVHSHAWSALAVAVVAAGRAAEAESAIVPGFMGATPLERAAAEAAP